MSVKVQKCLPRVHETWNKLLSQLKTLTDETASLWSHPNKAGLTWVAVDIFPDSLTELFKRETQIDSIKVDKSNYFQTFGGDSFICLMEVHEGF